MENPEKTSEKPSGDIMSFEEYATVEHERPYVFEVVHGDKKITYFGSHHIYNPDDPEITDIERAFDESNPDLVLVEGIGSRIKEQGKLEGLITLPRDMTAFEDRLAFYDSDI